MSIFIEYGSKSQTASFLSRPISPWDFTPNLLGIVDKQNVMLGQDLTNDKNSLVIFRDGSFTEGTHYFINRFNSISESICYEIETKALSDCAQLEEIALRAQESLRFSDLIIRNNLIMVLRDKMGSE